MEMNSSSDEADADDYSSGSSEVDSYSSSDNESSSSGSIKLPVLSKIKLDLSNEFGDAADILIDGDALLSHVFENHSLYWQYGGEFLHLHYLIERNLNLFVCKDAKFSILFFKDADIIWQFHPSFALVRKSLILHLQNNTKYTLLLDFKNTMDKNFANYLNEYIPTMVIMTYHDGRVKSRNYYFIVIVYQMLALNINVGLLEELCLGVSTLDGYHISANYFLQKGIDIKQLQAWYCNILKGFRKLEQPKISEKLQNSSDLSLLKVEVIAAIMYLETYKHEANSIDVVKIFLLYTAIKSLTPLSYRSFQIQSKCKDVEKICYKLQLCLFHALSIKKLDADFECSQISDLWDGNLFVNTLQLLQLWGYGDINEETNIMQSYNLLVKEVFEYLDMPITKLSWYLLPVMLPVSDNYDVDKNLNIIEQINIVPTRNELVSYYANDIYDSMNILEDDEKVAELMNVSKHFEDIYHYHCKKPINDLDTLLSITFQNKSINIDTDNKKKLQRSQAKIPRSRQVYSSFLGGNREKIVITLDDKSKSNSKKNVSGIEEKAKEGKGDKTNKNNKKKVSGKADKIREENRKVKENEKHDKQQHKLDLDLRFAKKFEVECEFEEALSVLDNIDIKFAINSSQFVKQILKVIQKCFDKTKGEKEKNHLMIKTLLLIRDIQENENLLKSYKNEIVNVLHAFKFYELSQMLYPDDVNPDKANSISHQIFQLENMGHLLVRDIRKDPDPRVHSFIPDEWQRQMFNYIDKKQSVLIVAPTSSGKTFASYYCMEKILRNNNNDVLVYVSPTKALCNQVMAMVDSLFVKECLPKGKSVCGIFTQDFRTNLSTCQILITVPQCLEILLLSADGFEWSRRIRYVIFDEMHCIGSEQGAEVWEHLLLLISCPFIALSATIENPEDLRVWLQNSQDFIKAKDHLLYQKRSEESYKINLVLVKGRYSDLQKFIYLPPRMITKENCCGNMNFIKPLHPICTLNIPGIRKLTCIPEHISLTPNECYKLYQAMKDTVGKNNNNLHSLNPNVYFGDDMFLKKTKVAEYSKELKEELYQWVASSVDCVQFTDLQKLLGKDIKEAERRKNNNFKICTASNSFVVNTFPQLMETLRKESMLPCIVFCLDRSLCETLVKRIIDYCEDQEKQYLKSHRRKSTKVNSNTKRAVKKEKNKKNSKRDKDEWDTQEDGQGSSRLGEFKDDHQWFGDECLSGVTFQGKGLNREEVSYFYDRLKYASSDSSESSKIFMKGIRYGVSYHHAGLNNHKRITAESLFRKKFINILVATSTLSHGIHVPCKTVVIAGDSVFLNPLEYRQMSGRAGRRGFDMVGNVIFSGIDQNKVKRLMSASLPKLKGNFPINVSLCLRLLIMVQGARIKNEKSNVARNDCIARALALLEHPLILQQNQQFKTQFKQHFLFSVQYLVREGYIDQDCQPIGLAGIIAHLHFHEPGNFAFVSCLKAELFHDLCKDYNEDIPDANIDLMRMLVLIVSYFFTNRPVHPNDVMERKEKKRYVNHVFLPPLPKEFIEHLEIFNSRVNQTFDLYLKSVATYCNETYGEDNVLPLSRVHFPTKAEYVLPHQDNCIEKLLYERSQKNEICSSFAALSGHTDEKLYDSKELINNIRQEVYTDVKVIPNYEINGVYLNSYALDFYKNENVKALVKENQIKSNEYFTLLKNFMLALKAISTSLELHAEHNTNDKVVKSFTALAKDFQQKFHDLTNY